MCSKGLALVGEGMILRGKKVLREIVVTLLSNGA